MAERRADFESLVAPIDDYLCETTARLPFVDLYLTDDKNSDGMRARPVIGGVFVKLLDNPATWTKWWNRDRAKIGDFAPAPVPPRVSEVIATSRHKPVVWRYTFEKPAGDWMRPEFDDGDWKRGAGGFGTAWTPGAVVGTTWNTPDIWLRRTVTLPTTVDPSRLQLEVYHDEDVEIYLNGIHAASEPGYRVSYDPVEIRPAALAALKPGAALVIAVSCHQTGGGQGVDVGLVEVDDRTPKS